MRKFAGAWRDIAIVQELLAQITWYHHIALLDKVKDPVTMALHHRLPGRLPIIEPDDVPNKKILHYHFPALSHRQPGSLSL